MASYDTKVIKLMASKLGVNSNNVIRKTSEFMRLLQLRTAASGGVRLGEVCRIVICLDLACSAVGTPLNKDDAISLSGVTKKVYSNGYHTVEKLLELSAPPTIASLSVQLGVGEIGEFAKRLLEKFIEVQSQNPPENRKIIDLSFPMYHAVATYVACKSQKVKVDQAKLLDLSRIKRADFKKLADEFLAIVNQISVPQKQTSKRSNKLMDLVEKYTKESEMETATRKNIASEQETKEEDFESWKRRLLGEEAEV